MTVPDYAALEAGLTAQRTARVLPPELVADVRQSPLLDSRQGREATLEWLRRQTPEDREGFRMTLREIRARYDADQTALDALWQVFGNETDRAAARAWWDAGEPLVAIAARLGWLYDADVTVPMITAWQVEDGWPARVETSHRSED